jgi:hypothetical protein
MSEEDALRSTGRSEARATGTGAAAADIYNEGIRRHTTTSFAIAAVDDLDARRLKLAHFFAHLHFLEKRIARSLEYHVDACAHAVSDYPEKAVSTVLRDELRHVSYTREVVRHLLPAGEAAAVLTLHAQAERRANLDFSARQLGRLLREHASRFPRVRGALYRGCVHSRGRSPVRRAIPIPVRVEPARRPSFEDRLRELRRPLQALDAVAAGRQFELPDGATLLKTTLSLCPECLAHVQAAVYSDAGRVFMSKTCPTHGLSRARNSSSGARNFGCRTAWAVLLRTRHRANTRFQRRGCCGPGTSCGPCRGRLDARLERSRGNKTCTVP